MTKQDLEKLKQIHSKMKEVTMLTRRYFYVKYGMSEHDEYGCYVGTYNYVGWRFSNYEPQVIHIDYTFERDDRFGGNPICIEEFDNVTFDELIEFDNK